VDIPVRGDGGDLGNPGCGGYRFGVRGQVGDDAVDGGLGAVTAMGLEPAATS
jgi:hypothetical protein